ncbi:MAG: NADH-quinone oxidoreductase subunit NuoH [Planctomycetes bacterium]|nr:NADH-quinone oxidoreductase subunit NuoH [Planctomycetota bacterium]
MQINWQLVIDIAKAVIVFFGILTCIPILVYAERKICAYIQDRRGPNRVGPLGLLQPVADAIKSFFKEDYTPSHVDKVLFTLAPAMAFIAPALVFAVIPFGHLMEIKGYKILPQVFDMNIGILFVLMIASLGGYGLILGGWSSNNKYSLLGGLRASAQMLSYEIAMGLAVISIIMTAGSTRMADIVGVQTQGLWGTCIPAWNIITQPIAFIVFLCTAFAETNRLPFDLAEGDSELIGGYHTEYSSMKFAMFFMGEYLAVLTMSALIVTLFLGGWYFPGITEVGNTSLLNGILSIFVFGTKVGMLVFFFIWTRWTLPRFRYDQLMKLGWKILLPLALFNIILTAILGLR